MRINSTTLDTKIMIIKPSQQLLDAKSAATILIDLSRLIEKMGANPNMIDSVLFEEEFLSELHRINFKSINITTIIIAQQNILASKL